MPIPPLARPARIRLPLSACRAGSSWTGTRRCPAWERRYGFINSVRFDGGSRLYQEKDISRILAVKRLLSKGVRISEAVTAVGAPDDRGAARGPMAVEL